MGLLGQFAEVANSSLPSAAAWVPTRGLPVVSSDADGLPENVADGQTGFIVPRRDPAALAEKLAHLAGDVELRRQMGAAGRVRVVNCFPLPAQIAAFDQFYREMVSCRAN